jgi:hypothetical protein
MLVCEQFRNCLIEGDTIYILPGTLPNAAKASHLEPVSNFFTRRAMNPDKDQNYHKNRFTYQ